MASVLTFFEQAAFFPAILHGYTTKFSYANFISEFVLRSRVRTLAVVTGLQCASFK